ncbi:DNA replication/repair protein RecF [Coraliomargarita akajimensis]|uniref:DNA replication and repair protein RecF n=1 Tax=Coraliomargarita akajimensis (strain DSM 45221 / IAM 15411 / JCM 23193 / KCTC 12865 / 04OKA010-24) TaxID=583355 RepID=D5EKQ5_CORAD|nr:DNA replication and repair protein RecF [Coraliomargarita akajimensis]ADE54962.1 DNA replication and repair protein RecF [Coraliomargarita akajimensis DSM 45221]
MRFKELRVQDFRNVSFAELDLSADRNFLLGPNGQGKSNLLEALGLVTALRSFRTQQMSALPRQGGSGGFAAVYVLQHELRGETELEIHSGAAGRRVLLDGEAIGRLGDFIGRFPVVPLSSGDLMILRGSPAERRRFLDLSLSAIDADYYLALRDYHKGVAERNRLLKRGGRDAEFDAFEAEIARHAVRLSAKRVSGMARLEATLVEVYAAIAESDEGPAVAYRPGEELGTVEHFKAMLERNRKRDQVLGSTQKGPHRDDFSLSLSTGGAKEYASDGQQRGLCVALRIAQAKLFQQALNVAPVLLADDVLGELDPHRKAGFWRACPDDWQLIASGTELPDGAESWAQWRVESGSFRRMDSA